MKPTERLKNLLNGKKLDPPGASLWKHFPVTDRVPSRFIERTLSFQRQFNWDFIKLCYNGLYSIEDWCPGILWPKTPMDLGEVKDFHIKSAKDWLSLEPLNPRHGALARETYITKAILADCKGEVPVLGTIFSPLTTAIKMTGEGIFDHMKNDKKALHRGLEVITRVTVELVKQLKALGIDGFFYATQLADADRLSPEVYEEFGTAYDRPVVEELTKGTWFNIFHLHGLKPMFKELERYPFQAVNWHDRRCGISLAEGRKLTDKILVGGIDEYGILKDASRKEIEAHLKDAVEQVPDGRLILAPGCVVPLTVDEGRFPWVREFRP
jgi:uroporphyrinogen decarboxylase